ncbi:uncharacterized protein LOC121367508 isoform X1 [Gigantopelta aegis]|uniref:uncharacterized protein LOC121367508 isoform X1 n=1 Tax=Gigantopelta aegis TaxID=1735272 RepID=UPI001B8898E8|nr:uncharacterized protein LOC121367508 isoform X1 [Gigantopelta aegis]
MAEKEQHATRGESLTEELPAHLHTMEEELTRLEEALFDLESYLTHDEEHLERLHEMSKHIISKIRREMSDIKDEIDRLSSPPKSYCSPPTLLKTDDIFQDVENANQLASISLRHQSTEEYKSQVLKKINEAFFLYIQLRSHLLDIHYRHSLNRYGYMSGMTLSAKEVKAQKSSLEKEMRNISIVINKQGNTTVSFALNANPTKEDVQKEETCLPIKKPDELKDTSKTESRTDETESRTDETSSAEQQSVAMGNRPSVRQEPTLMSANITLKSDDPDEDDAVILKRFMDQKDLIETILKKYGLVLCGIEQGSVILRVIGTQQDITSLSNSPVMSQLMADLNRLSRDSFTIELEIKNSTEQQTSIFGEIVNCQVGDQCKMVVKNCQSGEERVERMASEPSIKILYESNESKMIFESGDCDVRRKVWQTLFALVPDDARVQKKPDSIEVQLKAPTGQTVYNITRSIVDNPVIKDLIRGGQLNVQIIVNYKKTDVRIHGNIVNCQVGEGCTMTVTQHTDDGDDDDGEDTDDDDVKSPDYTAENDDVATTNVPTESDNIATCSDIPDRVNSASSSAGENVEIQTDQSLQRRVKRKTDQPLDRISEKPPTKKTLYHEPSPRTTDI